MEQENIKRIIGLLEAVREKKFRETRRAMPLPAARTESAATRTEAPRKGFLARLLAVFGIGKGDGYDDSAYEK